MQKHKLLGITKPITARFKSKGVTLIELMIVVVIIGVLAAIAYPSYQEQTRKARRSDGKNSLTEVANRLEKFYAHCNTYTTNFGGKVSDTDATKNCTGLAVASGDSVANINTAEGYYQLGITDINGATAAIAQGFRVTATPVAGKPQATDGMLALDSRGTKWYDSNKNGSFASTENSWQ